MLQLLRCNYIISYQPLRLTLMMMMMMMMTLFYIWHLHSASYTIKDLYIVYVNCRVAGS